jgi:hypothetical protein
MHGSVKKNVVLSAMLSLIFVPVSFVPQYTRAFPLSYCAGIIDSIKAEKSYTEIIPDTENLAFPMAYLYDNIWSITDPSPYSLDLIANDSILSLTLINDSADFSMPGPPAHVTSPYGWRDGHFHHGIDLDIYQGLPICSMFSGVVRFARYIQPYGRLVIVRHDNGLETYYAHMGRISVKPGQRVNAGDKVGTCGNTGHSRGYHLHFEMRFKGVSINPAHLISVEENKLKYSTILLRRNNDRFFVYTEGAVLYKVRRGDYLHKIAQEFGTTVKSIKAHNDIPKTGYLVVGQILCIYP